MKLTIQLRHATGLYYFRVPTKYVRDGFFECKKVYEVDIKEVEK